MNQLFKDNNDILQLAFSNDDINSDNKSMKIIKFYYEEFIHVLNENAKSTFEKIILIHLGIYNHYI